MLLVLRNWEYSCCACWNCGLATNWDETVEGICPCFIRSTNCWLVIALYCPSLFERAISRVVGTGVVFFVISGHQILKFLSLTLVFVFAGCMLFNQFCWITHHTFLFKASSSADGVTEGNVVWEVTSDVTVGVTVGATGVIVQSAFNVEPFGVLVHAGMVGVPLAATLALFCARTHWLYCSVVLLW